jgi:hypothetical protein
MSANILQSALGARFFNGGDSPAWWDIENRYIAMGQKNAVDALGEVGNYDVRKVALTIWASDLMKNAGDIGGADAAMPTDYSIIVRMPVPEDDQIRIFGSPVRHDYELITPMMAAEVVDRAWGNVGGELKTPIDTMGVLGLGETLFITSKVESFDVKGDEVQQYLYLHSPMYSNKAAHTGCTNVRIVCQNTMNIVLEQETNRPKYAIVHTPGALDELEKWLRQTHDYYTTVAEVTREALLLLANKKLQRSDAALLTEQVYPMPPAPDPEWTSYTGVSMERHEELYEQKKAKVQLTRSVIDALYQGDGTGMDTRAAKGTAFGWYNAVAEFETKRKGQIESAAVGVIVGDRASTITKAYVVARTFSSN